MFYINFPSSLFFLHLPSSPSPFFTFQLILPILQSVIAKSHFLDPSPLRHSSHILVLSLFSIIISFTYPLSSLLSHSSSFSYSSFIFFFFLTLPPSTVLLQSILPSLQPYIHFTSPHLPLFPHINNVGISLPLLKPSLFPLPFPSPSPHPFSSLPHNGPSRLIPPSSSLSLPSYTLFLTSPLLLSTFLFTSPPPSDQQRGYPRADHEGSDAGRTRAYHGDQPLRSLPPHQPAPRWVFVASVVMWESDFSSLISW